MVDRMTERPFQLRALGEIAIRCRDFVAMQDFYSRVLGLPAVKGSERGGYGDGLVFYRLGESFGGHVAVLALFDGKTASVSLFSGDMEIPLQAGLRCITAPPRAQSAVGRAGGSRGLARTAGI